MAYTKLFQPGKIGNVTIKNRIVMPPMGTGLALHNGEASDDIIRYYEERAKGGCGLIFTEITRVDEAHGWGLSNQLAMTCAGHIGRMQRLIDTVHKYGTKIFVQLHHPGREGHARLNPNGNPVVAPTAFVTERCEEMPHELTLEEAGAIIRMYVTAAKMAQLAGADGVELHGAHGYFLNQWLSPFSNKRTDKYGGSFENRCRFVDEIIYGIRKICGPDFPVGIRLSIDEYIGSEGIDLAMGVEIAKHFEAIGVSHINVSCGIYESGYVIIPAYPFPQACRRHLCSAVKAAVKIPVISINNIKEPRVAEQLLEEGACDFVAVGRGQLADPEWANKAKRGADDEIRKCIGCCRCIDAISYGRHSQCYVNPRLGREREYDSPVCDGAGRKVVVVGGGVAGMQAAKVLAERGFAVTLFEAEGKLGGALNVADKNVNKEKLTWLVETMKLELSKLDVDIRLNTRADLESISAISPDGVFVCCGGTHILPKVPGHDSEKAVPVKDYLLGKRSVGHNVAIIGSGATGVETAATLAKNGHEVTIIDMLPTIGNGIIERVMGVLRAGLKRMNVRMMPNTKLLEVTGLGAKLEDVKSGEVSELEFDSVVFAVGIRPQHEFAAQICEAYPNAVVLGDASNAATVFEAINDAFGAAWVYEP